jgi:hypothetical protein
MFTASQLVAHAVGDYLLQPHYMAGRKTMSTPWALAHATAYLLPFLLLTRSPLALLAMWGSHFLIDRFRLARYVCWLKNGPLVGWRGGFSWSGWAPLTATGYPEAAPAWLAVWLCIIADNCLHVLINGAALRWLA